MQSGAWRANVRRGVRPIDLVVIQVTQENEARGYLPGPTLAGRDELTSLVKELTIREQAVSDERRTLHAQIDALRRELVDRLRDEGNTVISAHGLGMKPLREHDLHGVKVTIYALKRPRG